MGEAGGPQLDELARESAAGLSRREVVRRAAGMLAAGVFQTLLAACERAGVPTAPRERPAPAPTSNPALTPAAATCLPGIYNDEYGLPNVLVGTCAEYRSAVVARGTICASGSSRFGLMGCTVATIRPISLEPASWGTLYRSGGRWCASARFSARFEMTARVTALKWEYCSATCHDGCERRRADNINRLNIDHEMVHVGHYRESTEMANLKWLSGVEINACFDWPWERTRALRAGARDAVFAEAADREEEAHLRGDAYDRSGPGAAFLPSCECPVVPCEGDERCDTTADHCACPSGTESCGTSHRCCAEGEVCCNDECITPAALRGRAAGAGPLAAAAGECALCCPPEKECCRNQCVDPATYDTDPKNCGHCGNDCGCGRCVDGACVPGCDTTKCESCRYDPAVGSNTCQYYCTDPGLPKCCRHHDRTNPFGICLADEQPCCPPNESPTPDYFTRPPTWKCCPLGQNQICGGECCPYERCAGGSGTPGLRSCCCKPGEYVSQYQSGPYAYACVDPQTNTPTCTVPWR